MEDVNEEAQFIHRPRMTILYKNWEGRIRLYNILPISIMWGATAYYPKEQWLLKAICTSEGKGLRTFALNRILEWRAPDA